MIFFFMGAHLYTQEATLFEPDSVKRTLSAVRTDLPIKIDGKLDEEAWQKQESSSGFIQVDPFQGVPATQDTDVKVLYDDKFLYFGIFCYDEEGRSAIRATDFKRDFSHKTHDLININIDAFNSERNAMTFAVNPYGVQRDYLSYDAVYYDIEWDAYWFVRTTRTDNGWLAEIAIPWKTLRYPKSSDEFQHWGIQIYRNRRLTNEISAFSPFPQSYPSARMDYAGMVENLQPPPSRSNIRIQPYTLVSYDRSIDYGLYDTKEETKFKLGGEIKWAISSNDVLDVTVNTDFAQADVDRQINNTSRFSVFFPETRPFFLENASLFGIKVKSIESAEGPMHIQPFFSRSIGLDNEKKPIPIIGGARYVHSSSTSNYGAIAIRQQGDSLTEETDFVVGRYSKNIGKQNRVGGLITYKNQYGNNNFTTSIDGFFRFGEAHSLNLLASYSGSTDQRVSGASAIAQYYYSTPKWRAWFTESVISKDYQPEMGFIPRKDIIGTTPGLKRYLRGKNLPLKKWVRAYEPEIAAQFYHKASSGELLERKLLATPLHLNLQSGGYLGYGISGNYQLLEASFYPLGIEIGPGDYNYTRHFLTGSSDPSKKINVSGEIVWGNYFDGQLSSYDLQLTLVPIPHIALSGLAQRLSFNKVGLNRITKDVDIYGLEGRLALNPRLQLTGIFQKNTENDLENLNLRFSWEYQPLSYVYLVYNQRNFTTDLQVRHFEEQAIFKVSFVKQF